MKKSWPVLVYRTIAAFAVLHSLALLGLIPLTNGREWGTRLWFALATLWFFWPIALMLHSGRSVRRLVVSLTIAVVLMVPSFWMYNSTAPYVLGWPDGLRPSDAIIWTSAYLAGRAEAKRDIKNGHLVIEEAGFGAGSGHRFEILRDRYGIELKALAQCVVSTQILGHEHGYNSVSKPEIERRYGSNAIPAAFEEGYQLDSEEVARRQQREKELAFSVRLPKPDRDGFSGERDGECYQDSPLD